MENFLSCDKVINIHHIKPEILPTKPDVLLRAYGNFKYASFTKSLETDGNIVLKLKILREIKDSFIDKHEVKSQN